MVGEDGDDIIVGSDTNGSGEVLQGNASARPINTRNIGTVQYQADGALPGRTDGISDLSIVGDDAHGGDGNDVS